MRLKLILIFIILFSQLNAQDIDEKYVGVYHYLDSLHQKEFNVSPVIKYIGTSPFNSQPQIINCATVPKDIKDSKLFYRKYYFQPYIHKDFDSAFNNKKNYNYYLLFSKPVQNTLFVELRKGTYNLKNLNKPYFGSADKYIFIFNEENEIIKSFKETIIYN
jgi:hypothetical protein